MTAARLTAVTLRQGSRTVLSDVTFALPEAAFIGLLGPNGAGKTTLLRALLGLIPPVIGTIEVLGAPARPGRRAIGYMPQTRAQAATLRLSARDVLAAAAGGTRWAPPITTHAERHAIDRALDMVGVTHLADRPFAALSGGERQRLLLAQALIEPPKLLLLDEPLTSLDPTAQSHIIELVRGLQHRLGCTVVFSSHELNPILPALDDVLYLAGGHAAIGTVEQIITSPTLTGLYGSAMEVVWVNGTVLVMAAPKEGQRLCPLPPPGSGDPNPRNTPRGSGPQLPSLSGAEPSRAI